MWTHRTDIVFIHISTTEREDRERREVLAASAAALELSLLFSASCSLSSVLKTPSCHFVMIWRWSAGAASDNLSPHLPRCPSLLHCPHLGLCVCVWVVVSGPFTKFFPCNHIINIEIVIFFFRRSKRQRNFSLFFLLHKRAKPILSPYLLPHPRARTQNLYCPLAPWIRHESAHPSAHSSAHPQPLSLPG